MIAIAGGCRNGLVGALGGGLSASWLDEGRLGQTASFRASLEKSVGDLTPESPIRPVSPVFSAIF